MVTVTQVEACGARIVLMERLAERHEALTHTVELVARMQLQNEKAQAKNEVLLAHVMESVDSLARVAHVHERRISDLEGGRA